jgi:biotin operon repressor|tara:strand:- start:169 stop:375 length:207 start_codon:yes stop_codon:yes gene_type:complete
MANFDDSTIHMSQEDIKKELKALKKKVKQMEAQREKVREWAHKAELLDAKKMKLRYKEILAELDKDET